MGTSTFLFAEPSFLEGWSRLLDLGGTLTEFNSSLTGEQADYVALSQDWKVIGGDIQTALETFRKELITKK